MPRYVKSCKGEISQIRLAQKDFVVYHPGLSNTPRGHRRSAKEMHKGRPGGYPLRLCSLAVLRSADPSGAVMPIADAAGLVTPLRTHTVIAGPPGRRTTSAQSGPDTTECTIIVCRVGSDIGTSSVDSGWAHRSNTVPEPSGSGDWIAHRISMTSMTISATMTTAAGTAQRSVGLARGLTIVADGRWPHLRRRCPIKRIVLGHHGLGGPGPRSPAAVKGWEPGWRAATSPRAMKAMRPTENYDQRRGRWGGSIIVRPCPRGARDYDGPVPVVEFR
jgi:hypothetical protein